VERSNAHIGSSAVDTVRALPLKDKFAEVYERNIFGGADSRSGAGSDLLQTEIIRREIPRILRENGIASMLDAPCGDWFWMREVDLGIERYVGADIVDALIERNKFQFGGNGVDFICLDLSKDQLPEVDLIFSRDCLVHLSYRDAARMLNNFKASGARYLLTTTFPDRSSNIDLGDGFWRPLNMELPPFNFPPPIELINEGCTEGHNQFTDKSIGLWRLKDILA
jgi:SAM-dependent methyltransferase